MKRYVDFNSQASKINLHNEMKALKGVYVVEIKEVGRSRSAQQNSYYWAAIVPAMLEGYRELGWDYTLDDTHEEIKKTFLSRTIRNELTGEERVVVGSTASLSTKEFIEFVERVARYAAEHMSIVILQPC